MEQSKKQKMEVRNQSRGRKIDENTQNLDVIILNANKQKVEINVKHLTVECEEDGKLMEMVQEAVHRLYSAVMPIPTQSLM